MLTLLDVGGPYEVFLTADRLARRLGITHRFDVVVAGSSTEPVTAFGGMTITRRLPPSGTEVDIALIPGAIAIDTVLESQNEGAVLTLSHGGGPPSHRSI